jgi:hypothetical protein
LAQTLADLFGFAREIQIGPRPARHHQGRVPESVPLFALDHFRGQLDLQIAERGDLLLRETSNAAGHFKFGREVATEDDPRARVLASGQLLD